MEQHPQTLTQEQFGQSFQCQEIKMLELKEKVEPGGKIYMAKRGCPPNLEWRKTLGSKTLNSRRKMEEPGFKYVGPTLLTAFFPFHCNPLQDRPSASCSGKSVSPSRMGLSAQLFVVLINSGIKLQKIPQMQKSTLISVAATLKYPKCFQVSKRESSDEVPKQKYITVCK